MGKHYAHVEMMGFTPGNVPEYCHSGFNEQSRLSLEVDEEKMLRSVGLSIKVARGSRKQDIETMRAQSEIFVPSFLDSQEFQAAENP